MEKIHDHRCSAETESADFICYQWADGKDLWLIVRDLMEEEVIKVKYCPFCGYKVEKSNDKR